MEPLTEREQSVMNLLSAETEQCITQLEKSSGIRQILPVIKSLLEKEAVKVKEELKRSYKPRTEARVRLTPGMQDEEKLRGLFDGLARAPKQLAVLMKYIELSGWGTSGTDLKEVTRKSLLEASGASSAILNGLTGKGILNYTIRKWAVWQREYAIRSL